MYEELSKYYSRTSNAIHYDNLEHKGTNLYFIGRNEPLTDQYGHFRKITVLKNILGKNRLDSLGYDRTIWPKSKNVEAIKKALEEMPSASDIDRADDIELQEIVRDTTRRIESLNQQLEAPMQGLLGPDKQLKSIRGALKVEVAKKVQLEQHIELKKEKLAVVVNPTEFGDDQCKEIRKRIEKLMN